MSSQGLEGPGEGELGPTTPLASGSPPDSPLPRKPRGQRHENMAVPATTELWQTLRPAQGPEWQGSSSWHHAPTQPGGHLWAETAQCWQNRTESPRDMHKTGQKQPSKHTHSHSRDKYPQSTSYILSSRNRAARTLKAVSTLLMLAARSACMEFSGDPRKEMSTS